MSNYIKKLLVVLGVIIFASCEKPEDEVWYSSPCVGGECFTSFFIDKNIQPNAYIDDNGYWHIEYYGPNYFTVGVGFTQIKDEYLINDVYPTEAAFDSNYWVAFDDMKFTIPVYSPFGLYNQVGSPIPIGDYTYDISDIASQMEPLNIAGYQITKKTCFDCPYSDRLFATYAKYGRDLQQQMYLDKRMVGDTLEVYVKATYNTEGLVERGDQVLQQETLKIIVNDELPWRN